MQTETELPLGLYAFLFAYFHRPPFREIDSEVIYEAA